MTSSYNCLRTARSQSSSLRFTFMILRPPSRSPLFPYTTLFRSIGAARVLGLDRNRIAQAIALAVTPNIALHATRRGQDRKSTRLNSSHQIISYAVFCLKKKNTLHYHPRPVNQVDPTEKGRELRH